MPAATTATANTIITACLTPTVYPAVHLITNGLKTNLQGCRASWRRGEADTNLEGRREGERRGGDRRVAVAGGRELLEDSPRDMDRLTDIEEERRTFLRRFYVGGSLVEARLF